MTTRPPFETAADAEIARARARGTPVSPRSSASPSGPTLRCLHEAGIPTVLFGPRGEGAHAVVEWVEIASLERCLEVYVAVAAELCG